MSVYRVIGALRYREHEPGSTFEATLEPRAEERAIRRGAIEVVDRRPTTIQPGSWTLPDGWPSSNQQQEG